MNREEFQKLTRRLVPTAREARAKTGDARRNRSRDGRRNDFQPSEALLMALTREVADVGFPLISAALVVRTRQPEILQPDPPQTWGRSPTFGIAEFERTHRHIARKLGGLVLPGGRPVVSLIGDQPQIAELIGAFCQREGYRRLASISVSWVVSDLFERAKKIRPDLDRELADGLPTWLVAAALGAPCTLEPTGPTSPWQIN